MIMKITTEEFSKLDLKGKKKVFAQFLGHKVNEITYGGMTNRKWGEFQVRHETYAYSYIKVEPTKDGYVHMTIYNFDKKEWLETAE